MKMAKAGLSSLRVCRTELQLCRTAVLHSVSSAVSNWLVLPTVAVMSVSVMVLLITTVISASRVAHLQLVAVICQ
jgi:hypothetical protein